MRKVVLIILLPLLITSCVYRPQVNTDREAEIIAKSIAVNNEFVEFFQANSASIDDQLYAQIVQFQNQIANDLADARILLQGYEENPNEALLSTLRDHLAKIQENLGILQEVKQEFLKWQEEQKGAIDSSGHTVSTRSSEVRI